MDDNKFDNVYKLLAEHNFGMNENVPDKLKCFKCRKILINACQTRCGCRFCRNCIDEMMMNGCQVCPGITDDCKIALLSNASLDYRANNKISKLILKCPEEMCSQKCELINMGEHIRICGKKSVKCPFYDMGCDEKKVMSEMMNSHFQLENYNIKNEIVGLRAKEDRNNKEIEKMKENLKLKDEGIKSLNTEMELMKKEKMKLENRVKTLEEIADDKIGKVEKEELEKKMEISFGNFNRKMDEIIVEMRQVRNDCNYEPMIFQQARQTIKQEMMEMRIEPRINQLEKFVDCQRDGIFEMAISNVDEWRNKRKYIWSEYFYVRMQPYKLRLCVWPFGDELMIRFFICDDAMNDRLKWPFKADVTIKIMNKNKPDACKSITEKCQINRPPNNDCNSSEHFIYSFPDLTKNGLLESNCFIVQFSVVFGSDLNDSDLNDSD